nr:ATP synthase F0 subunit 6 [Aspiculuris sp. PC-2022]
MVLKVDLLFFFYLFVYIYLFQFFFVYDYSYIGVLVRVFPGFFVRHLGFLVKMPLSYEVMGFYFLFMVSICYVGHFSWNLALGRVVDFVVVWAFIGWLMGVLIFLSEEIFSNVLGLYGEGYLGVLYSVWGKTISVVIRPMTLSLRLFVNLSIGHFLISRWLSFGIDNISVFSLQFVLTLIVFYEMFVFILQSFIFSRLMEVYLEEC